MIPPPNHIIYEQGGGRRTLPLLVIGPLRHCGSWRGRSLLVIRHHHIHKLGSHLNIHGSQPDMPVRHFERDSACPPRIYIYRLPCCDPVVADFSPGNNCRIDVLSWHCAVSREVVEMLSGHDVVVAQVGYIVVEASCGLPEYPPVKDG
jgi:hypothetical protein